MADPREICLVRGPPHVGGYPRRDDEKHRGIGTPNAVSGRYNEADLGLANFNAGPICPRRGTRNWRGAEPAEWPKVLTSSITRQSVLLHNLAQQAFQDIPRADFLEGWLGLFHQELD